MTAFCPNVKVESRQGTNAAALNHGEAALWPSDWKIVPLTSPHLQPGTCVPTNQLSKVLQIEISILISGDDEDRHLRGCKPVRPLCCKNDSPHGLRIGDRVRPCSPAP